MNIARSFLAILTACAFMLAMGCSSSKQMGSTTETAAPPPTEKVTPPADTLTVDTKNAEKPSYEPKTPPSTSVPMPPAGKFTVQVGAYKMPDNADRIAALAKERFTRPVYTFLDKADNLYKVMIGDFLTKDDARKFRDDMVQKYPSDYNDAWVSENAQQ